MADMSFNWPGLHKFRARLQLAHNVHANGVTHIRKLCVVLIPLCKDNLNLPMFVFFSALCLVI